MLNPKDIKKNVQENAKIKKQETINEKKHQDILKMQAQAIEVNELNIIKLTETIYNLINEQRIQNDILIKEIEAKKLAEKREKIYFWIATISNIGLAIATVTSLIVSIII